MWRYHLFSVIFLQQVTLCDISWPVPRPMIEGTLSITIEKSRIWAPCPLLRTTTCINAMRYIFTCLSIMCRLLSLKPCIFSIQCGYQYNLSKSDLDDWAIHVVVLGMEKISFNQNWPCYYCHPIGGKAANNNWPLSIFRITSNFGYLRHAYILLDRM